MAEKPPKGEFTEIPGSGERDDGARFDKAGFDDVAFDDSGISKKSAVLDQKEIDSLLSDAGGSAAEVDIAGLKPLTVEELLDYFEPYEPRDEDFTRMREMTSWQERNEIIFERMNEIGFRLFKFGIEELWRRSECIWSDSEAYKNWIDNYGDRPPQAYVRDDQAAFCFTVFDHAEFERDLDSFWENYTAPDGERNGSSNISDQTVALFTLHMADPNVGVVGKNIRQQFEKQSEFAARHNIHFISPEQTARILFAPIKRQKSDAARIFMLSDEALSSRADDVLGYGDYAEAIADLIDNAETRAPLTIAINAKWGVGKTSLANMVREQLTEPDVRGVATPHRSYWFNAWKHDEAQDLGQAFLQDFARHLQSLRPWWVRCFRPLSRQLCTDRDFTGRRRRYLAFWWSVIFLLCFGMVQWGGLDPIKSLRLAQSGGEPAPLPLMANLIFVGLLSAVIVKLVLDNQSAVSNFLHNRPRPVDSGSLEIAIRDRLEALVKSVTPEGCKFVVFLDDLERCRPPRSIDVLEVVNQLMDFDPVVTVVIADMPAIAANAEIKYEKLAARYNPDDGLPPQAADNGAAAEAAANNVYGRLFLQKFIQLQFDLPRMREDLVRDMMTGLVGKTEERDGSDADGGAELDDIRAAPGGPEPAAEPPLGFLRYFWQVDQRDNPLTAAISSAPGALKWLAWPFAILLAPFVFGARQGLGRKLIESPVTLHRLPIARSLVLLGALGAIVVFAGMSAKRSQIGADVLNSAPGNAVVGALVSYGVPDILDGYFNEELVPTDKWVALLKKTAAAAGALAKRSQVSEELPRPFGLLAQGLQDYVDRASVFAGRANHGTGAAQALGFIVAVEDLNLDGGERREAVGRLRQDFPEVFSSQTREILDEATKLRPIVVLESEFTTRYALPTGWISAAVAAVLLPMVVIGLVAYLIRLDQRNFVRKQIRIARQKIDEDSKASDVDSEDFDDENRRDSHLDDGTWSYLYRRNRLDRLERDSDVFEDARNFALEHITPVPRNTKRLMNRLRLHIGLIDRSGALRDGKVTPEQIGKWIVLQDRWPEVASAISAHPDLAGEIENLTSTSSPEDRDKFLKANGLTYPPDSRDRLLNLIWQYPRLSDGLEAIIYYGRLPADGSGRETAGP